MPFSPEKKRKPLRKPTSWPKLWFKNKSSLKHVVFKMQLDSFSAAAEAEKKEEERKKWDQEGLNLDSSNSTDLTSFLSDEILLKIFSYLPEPQRIPNSLVCKRWFSLHGKLHRSVKLLEWNFLESGLLISRFPNLTDVDIVPACIESPRNSGILLSHSFISINLESDFSDGKFIREEHLLPSNDIDQGLRILAKGCPNLRKLVFISATEAGLATVARECPTLQELELHRCDDLSLGAITECANLQILKLIAFIEGLYDSVISDIGLTILAHGCKRLVKLDLSGCEGSYDGISAIGKCCPMLEDLTLSDHRMDGGWIAALSSCSNLKTLKLQGCKKIDPEPGPEEHLGLCPMLERLQLQRCQLRDKEGMKALFMVCASVREVVVQDCWGLDNDMFGIAIICRRVKFLSLEGCSLLTTEGLESVILFWKELQRLRVVSCNSIRDSEITPALSSVFSVLKEFQWRPDSRSVLVSSLAGTGMRTKGGRFFKKA